ncbi:MAG: hypothetical protein CMM56_10455 [Rhodospirillaceae bacterium]|nr:hypothetical protein [Rhodospirillaceae bacterium]
MSLKSLLKDPLLHFLGLGLGLLVLFQITGNQESENSTVIVDRETLLTCLQYQSVAFDREQFELFLDDMTKREIEDLIAEAVREEILHREALALELDRDDYIIRSRLVQKLRYLSEGFSNDEIVLSSEEIQSYFENNRSNYDIDPFITFTHVFFNAQRRGQENALNLAEEKLIELNESNVSFSESSNHGDRFPYFVNYIERPPQLIASHFGGSVADALFQIAPNTSIWNGPFESSFGFHLIMVTDQEPERMPSFEEVINRVETDARAAKARENTELAIQEIMNKYDVVIDPNLIP